MTEVIKFMREISKEKKWQNYYYLRH
jgi:hypothetical protein